MKYFKAYLGCVIAVVGSLTDASLDGHLTLHEYLVAAGAGLVALGVVAVAGNKPGTTK
jgi:hypothetical protein